MSEDYKEEYEGSWVGIDFDGTLAEYHGWKGPDVLGKPIQPMVDIVKQFIKEGQQVKIMTARVSSNAPPGKEDYPSIARKAIEDWCMEVFGYTLPVTAEKDYLMKELWDDRVILVEFNTGRVKK
jgi:hypothetical protein